MTDGEPPYHAQGIIAEIHKCGTSWTREFMKQNLFFTGRLCNMVTQYRQQLVETQDSDS